MENETMLLNKKRKALKNSLIERENKKRELHELKDFHFLSANLSRFMPQIPVQNHWQVYLNVLSTMMLRDFDVQMFDFAESLESNFYDKKIKPKIYITCHLGFCKASISILILKGIYKIALIVDENTLKKQSQTIQALHSKFRSLTGLEYEIKIINVERIGSVLEIMQLIKEGFSLFAYIDGNSGYKGVYNKENTIEIPFLNSSIVSRTGLSAISYLTKTAIVPFVSYYDENDIPKTEFLDEISFKGETMHEFMESSTRAIYKGFEKYICKYYDQWESWFYVHKYLDEDLLKRKDIGFEIETISSETIKDFNLATFKINESFYLFDKKNYLIYPISESQFKNINELV